MILSKQIEAKCRICVDIAPLLERTNKNKTYFFCILSLFDPEFLPPLLSLISAFRNIYIFKSFSGRPIFPFLIPTLVTFFKNSFLDKKKELKPANQCKRQDRKNTRKKKANQRRNKGRNESRTALVTFEPRGHRRPPSATLSIKFRLHKALLTSPSLRWRPRDLRNGRRCVFGGADGQPQRFSALLRHLLPPSLAPMSIFQRVKSKKTPFLKSYGKAVWIQTWSRARVTVIAQELFRPRLCV